MKAWIENNRVRDIAQGNPQDNYHPDVAKLYDTEVPDGTVSGATLVAGVWTNPPPPPIPTAEEIAAAEAARLLAVKPAAIITQWQAIKAKRDSIKSAGAQVGAYWFHTDADSRIQQLGLKDQARDVLAAGGNTATVLQKLGQDIPWQTMSGVSTPMTVQLSFAVVAAVGDLDALCHYVTLQHNAAIEASTDPAAYDISTGWPATFKPE